MPRHEVARDTSFIVEDEAWSVVEYDHSSVKGVMYLSLSEEKVNIIYDDLTNDIADTDRLAKYEVVVGDETQSFVVGDIIEPTFSIMKNGTPIEINYQLIPEDKKIVKYVNEKLTAMREGETALTVQLVDYPEICGRIQIAVGAPIVFSAYIEGNDTIRLGRSTTYKLIGTADFNIEDVVYYLDETALASISVKNGVCVVKANEKNKLGKITLRADFGGTTYTKEIEIIPLW